MAFQLLIARGNGEGQQFVVVQPVVLIGKDADNDVVLSDVGVSRQHARIVEKQGRWWAEDLGSAGGTFLNGDRLAAPRELKTGDALALGTALLRFVELDEGRARAAAPAPKAVPNIPVAGLAVTGEQAAAPGRLPPPVADHEIVTASGEGDPLPWDRSKLDRPKLYDDAEVTAPVGKPLVFEDATVPVGQALKVERTQLQVPKEPEPKGLVPAPASVRKLFEPSELKTTAVLPEPDRARIEGPTQIKAPAPLALAEPLPSFNKLLREQAHAPVPKAEDSLAPLDLSRSDLQSLQQLAEAADATRADAAPLHETSDSTGEGLALPARAPSPRLTNPLPPRETAAERSRRRRLAGESLGHQLGAGWDELPLRTRAIAAVVAGLAVSGVIIGLYQFFRPDPGPPLPSEPDRLLVSHERVRYFFGLGEGVEYPRPDAKDFTFDFVTPTDAAILVHYQAREIGRDEVAISVNGADVGFVPPDINVPDREIETLVPQRVLKRGEKNTLVFDNVHNPPGKDPWRVGELWLELLPVPPSAPADAIRRARDLAKQAGQLYAQRDVGSDNIFRSWKAYRLAWQVLLAVPEGQRTSLFDQMRSRASELAQELDQQCGQLMLDAKKQMELKNPDKAKEILESVSLTFPTNEHRCHQLANERLDEYQL